MATTEKLIKYMLDNQEALDLEVEHFNWTKSWGLNLYDLEVKITIDDRFFTGRGTDENQELAFCKASAEALERATVFYSPLKNSNGVAAHIDRSKAIEASKNELLERDIYLCHYLTTIPMKRIDYDKIAKKDKIIKGIIVKLAAKELDLHILEMNSALDNIHTICVAVFGEQSTSPFGMTIGFGTNADLITAIKSALFESMRNVSNFMENPKDIPAIDVIQFWASETITGREHLQLSKSFIFTSHVKDYFEKSNHTYENTYSWNTEVNAIVTEEVVADIPLLNNAPLHVYYSSSDKVQDLYFGEINEDKINLSRLSQFAGKEVAIESLPYMPHPFG